MSTRFARYGHGSPGVATARIMGSLGVVLLLLAVAAGTPPPALGSTAAVFDSNLDYSANPGEENVVAVSFSSGVYTITDTGPGVAITPGAGCSGGGQQVTCTAATLTMSLNDQNDTLTFASSGASQDFADGGDGDDTLTGGPGRERLLGGDGGDTISGNDGNDSIAGGFGNDSLDGGAGDDDFEQTFIAAVGTDSIQGGLGDDRLFSGLQTIPGFIPGAQTFSGGPGRDAVDYSSRTVPLTVTLDGQPGDGQVGEQDNIGADVEGVVGGSANDTLVGNPSDNQLDGRDGEDTASGAAGNDTLEGGTDAGSDTLDGGDGDDAASGGPGDDALSGGAGLDTLDGGGGTDTVIGGEGLDTLRGGAGIDSLSGGPGDDVVQGGAPALIGADGGDALRGDEGNDSLLGDAGDDVLDGGQGADTLGGGEGIDTVDYQFRLEEITVTIDGRPNDGAAGEADNVATDVENVRGGRFDDTFTGDQRSNVLDGLTGEDYADGRDGRDELSGGDSGDVLRSRDGVPDRVACGDGTDFVIADRTDRFEQDCERVDAGRRRTPTFTKTALVRPVKGTLAISPTRIRRFVPLMDLVNLPLRSRIDTRSGAVSLRTAPPRGRAHRARLAGGVFQVLQPRREGGITDIVLKGGNFRQCRAGGRTASGDNPTASQLRRTAIRRLRARARGRFRASGRNSAALVRGTDFEVIDRCDGTLTRVRRGTVVVRDFRLRRTITLRAGESYLARAAG